MNRFRHAPLLLALMLAAGPVRAASDTLPTLLAMTPAQIQASGVRLVHPEMTRGGQGPSFSGRVTPAPDAEWVITAPMDGVVTRLRVGEGDAVRPGTVLLDLKAPGAPLLAAEWIRSEGAARVAAAERQRDRALHADGIIPARRLEATEQKALEAESARDAAGQELKLLGVSVGEARQGLLPLRAPSAAIVTGRVASLGQRVATGDALIRLADPQRLALELQVPVAASTGFRAGDTLIITDAANDQALPAVRARVTQVGWGVATQERSTVVVRASLQGGALRPGQWLRAHLDHPQPGMLVWQVPSAAVLRQGNQELVFVQRPGGFHPAPVTRLGEQAGKVLVQGPLDPADNLVASGTITLKSLMLRREAP